MKKHLKCCKINQKTTTTTTDLLSKATSEYKKKKSQLHNENIVWSAGWHLRQRAVSLDESSHVEQRDAPTLSDALQVCFRDGLRPVTISTGIARKADSATKSDTRQQALLLQINLKVANEHTWLEVQLYKKKLWSNHMSIPHSTHATSSTHMATEASQSVDPNELSW